jgi:enamine deaminase RidA (YjgF/YER057c/UK114 family)
VRYIKTNNAPEPGAYSQAVLVDPEKHNLLFLAGQTGNIPGICGEPVVEGGLGPQTVRALENIVAVVISAGGCAKHIVEIKVFLKDSEAVGEERQKEREESRKTFGSAYVAFFEKYGIKKDNKNLPARTLVWVSEVPLEYPNEDTLVELTAVAVIPKRK